MNASRLIHRALVFSTDEEYLATIGPVLEEGAAAGDLNLVVGNADSLALLDAALDARTRAGTEFVDAAGWYRSPARTIAAYHAFLESARGRPGLVRVIGELVWSDRSAQEIREWKRYEAGVNVIFGDYPVLCVCPYDTRRLPPEVLADVAVVHPQLTAGVRSWRSPGYRDPFAFAAGNADTGLDAPPAGAARFRFMAGQLRAVRAFVMAQARRGGIPRDRIQGLVLAVHEVATNALRHGSGTGTLYAWRSGRALIVDLVDPCTTFDCPFAGYFPPEGGRGAGLWLARQLCDDVAIEPPARAPGPLRVRLRVESDPAADSGG